MRETATLGIANKMVRLRMLEAMAQRALARNFDQKAAAFLEQAAKECGGLYERHRRQDPSPPADAVAVTTEPHDG